MKTKIAIRFFRSASGGQAVEATAESHEGFRWEETKKAIKAAFKAVADRRRLRLRGIRRPIMVRCFPHAGRVSGFMFLGSSPVGSVPEALEDLRRSLRQRGYDAFLGDTRIMPLAGNLR